MRRLVMLIVATAAVIALLVTIRAADRSDVRNRPAALSSPPTALPTLGSPSSSTSAVPPPHYRSGTVVKEDHTDYGTVRLKVTTKNGRIVEIGVLQLPHANEVDRELSEPAARALTREVLRVQTADVDIVSGATYTSQGYLNSLQAALDQLS
jgi:uncharacterized protein with FMN-binding domain